MEVLRGEDLGPLRPLGSLKVNISRPTSWRAERAGISTPLGFREWLHDNETVVGVEPGVHTVRFETLGMGDEWVAPAEKAVTIEAYQTTLVEGVYEAV